MTTPVKGGSGSEGHERASQDPASADWELRAVRAFSLPLTHGLVRTHPLLRVSVLARAQKLPEVRPLQDASLVFSSAGKWTTQSTARARRGSRD